jgi:hypothetical protein
MPDASHIDTVPTVIQIFILFDAKAILSNQVMEI